MSKLGFKCYTLLTRGGEGNTSCLEPRLQQSGLMRKKELLIKIESYKILFRFFKISQIKTVHPRISPKSIQFLSYLFNANLNAI